MNEKRNLEECPNETLTKLLLSAFIVDNYALKPNFLKVPQLWYI